MEEEPKRSTDGVLEGYFQEDQDNLQGDWLVFQQLIHEPDRITAIVGGAHVDEALGAAVRSRLEVGEETDWLLSSSGPLGPFGARIAAARA